MNLLIAGIGVDLADGLTRLRDGLRDQLSPGLTALLLGFNRTEAVYGEPGIVEGLSKIRGGLSNPVGDPGVSEGLGLVLAGIRGEVLDGVNDLQEGVAAGVIPGLEKIETGIREELQPGFTKVSALLLVIWLVTSAILSVASTLIDRARKARASANKSASV